MRLRKDERMLAKWLSLWIVVGLITASGLTGCATPAPSAASLLPTLEKLNDPSAEVKSFTLDNGLEVVVVERPTVPLVTILAAVRNGAFAEPPEYDGLSHLYEHMFFKGNAVLPDQEAYMARMRELGMSFNGTTSTEAVEYFFTLPKENLAAGLEFMNHALTGPLFDEQELKREIQTVLSEYDRNESDPRFFLRQAVTQKLFSHFPSRKNVIGERDVISKTTREQMLTIQHRFYVPNNTLLVVAGDVQLEAVKDMIFQQYSSWPKGVEPFEEWPSPQHPPMEKAQMVVVERPFQNVAIDLAWHGPSVDEDRKATYAADVFGFILSQKASTFHKRLVDSGMLLGAQVSYYTQRNVGPIHFMGIAEAQKAGQALAAMRAEAAHFVEVDYFTDEELASAKRLLAVDNLYGWQASQSIARELGFWWCVADMDYRLQYIENLKKVTREDVVDFVRTYIHERPGVTGILIAPENREWLDATAKQTTQAEAVVAGEVAP